MRTRSSLKCKDGQMPGGIEAYLGIYCTQRHVFCQTDLAAKRQRQGKSDKKEERRTEDNAKCGKAHPATRGWEMLWS
jgi:hypothetical protein